jgi:hypothetical protein
MTDYDYVECESVGGFPPTAYEIQVRQRGKYIVGIFRMNIEGWGDVVVRARVSIAQIQKILFRRYAGTISGYHLDEYAVEGFFDDLAKGAADIGKKIVRHKVFKSASKVLQHPAVLAVSQVIPGLNAVVPAAAMISKGLAMTDALTRARQGSKPDMHTIKKAIHIAKKGKGPKAIKAAKLLRMADKMSWAPSVAKQTASATKDIAQKTGVPTEAVKAAVDKVTQVDVPKPPPVAPRPELPADRPVPRRRKLTKKQKAKLMRQKKKAMRQSRKARAYFLKYGKWPPGYHRPHPEVMRRRRQRRYAYHAPPPPVPMPGQYAPLPPGAPPLHYGHIPMPAPRPAWTPSYPAYF